VKRSSGFPIPATGRKPLMPGVVGLHQAVTEARAGAGCAPSGAAGTPLASSTTLLTAAAPAGGSGCLQRDQPRGSPQGGRLSEDHPPPPRRHPPIGGEVAEAPRGRTRARYGQTDRV
jgi:hypothetical protein